MHQDSEKRFLEEFEANESAANSKRPRQDLPDTSVNVGNGPDVQIIEQVPEIIEIFDDSDIEQAQNNPRFARFPRRKSRSRRRRQRRYQGNRYYRMNDQHRQTQQLYRDRLIATENWYHYQQSHILLIKKSYEDILRFLENRDEVIRLHLNLVQYLRHVCNTVYRLC